MWCVKVVGQTLSLSVWLYPPTGGNDTVVRLLCYYPKHLSPVTSEEGGRLSKKVWIVTTQSRPNYNESYKPTV